MENFNKLLKKGLELQKKGSFKEALKIYNELILKDKKNAQLLLFLGTLHLQINNNEEAKNYLELSLDIEKNNITTISNLALAYEKLEKKEEAIKLFKKSIEISHNNPETFFRIANLYSSEKKYELAIENYQKAIKLKPNFMFAYLNLGNAQFESKFFEESILNFEKSISFNRKFIPSYLNICRALLKLEKFDQALKYCDEVIKLDKLNIQAFLMKGDINLILKNYSNAIQNYEQIIEIEPSYNLVLGKLLHAKMFVHDWKNYKKLLREVVQYVNKNLMVIHPSIFSSLTDQPNLHLKASKIYINQFYKKDLVNQNFGFEKKSKINIGYFSSDFYDHATLRLMMDVFEYHDKSKFNIFGFAYGPNKNDNYTKKLRTFLHDYHYVEDMSSDEIYHLCRKNHINIAIDLKGYTQHNRLEIFKRRIAPIQISFLGYPGTTGLNTMDYILADNTIIPEKYSKFYSEKILHLPGCYQPNIINKNIFSKKISRKDYGLDEDKFIFCSFNFNYKITQEMFNLWIEILEHAPNSILWMLVSNDTAQKNLQKYAQTKGINSNRIVFTRYVPESEHLNRMRFGDVFLDSFPINAHTTASDALRMGLPIITLKGKSFASRVAASIIHQFDLDELVTSSTEEYKNKAIELYNNPIGLKEIKKKLDNNREKSKLFDSKRFTINLEKIYLEVFKKKI